MGHRRRTVSRAARVARWFGVSAGDAPAGSRIESGAGLAIPAAGEILLISGPSGAGKSVLLRGIWRRYRRQRRRVIDLGDILLPDRAVVDCIAGAMGAIDFVDEDGRTIAALEALSRVGLGEVWTYLRRPRELSEGQRWRLRLAMALARARDGDMLICDEFCALLDRMTAAIVSRTLRKAVDANGGISVVVATSHEDLSAALRPDRTVVCDFGEVSLKA